MRLTLDEGCYRVSFGEHASDPDAAVNEGDVMRVQVTVPQQTGYNTGAVIRQGWVIAKAFTAASTFTAGKSSASMRGVIGPGGRATGILTGRRILWTA